MSVFMFIFSTLITPVDLYSQSSGSERTNDTVSHLNEIVISADAKDQYRRDKSGVISVNSTELSSYIQTMGEPDPIKHILLLPGVHVADDYASGFSVEGTNYSQSMVQIDGAPLFFPYHFGGIFSLLNPRYFKRVNFSRQFPLGESSSRLGARLDANSPMRIYSKPSASISLGLISSGVSAIVPFNSKLQFSLVARVSYLNLFLAPLLNDGDMQYRYGFEDCNASLLYKPNSRNSFTLAFSGNTDRLSYLDNQYLNKTHIKWSNRVGSLRWLYNDGHISSETSAWWSQLGSRLGIDLSTMQAAMRSDVMQAGMSTIVRLLNDKPGNKLNYSFGANLSYTRFNPSQLSGNWLVEDNNLNLIDDMIEAQAFAALDYSASSIFNLHSRVGADICGNKQYSSILPLILLSPRFHFRNHDLNINLAFQPQYFHQVGFSEIGLASNFWIGSSPVAPPERAISLSAEWIYNFANSEWETTISPYFKLIDNESDYGGGLYDLMGDNYNPYDHIVTGAGYNTGVDLSLRRRVGKLTGWLSYSFGIARRRYSDNPDQWVVSRHEILNRVKLFLAWNINTHWQLGANFNYATGRPITPITEVFVIANNVIMNYGVRNSSRLPDYHRLDLSASYSFHTGGKLPLKHSFNFSLLNAYGHKNVEFSHFRYNADTGMLYRKNSGSLFRFLPSISYEISF